MSLPFGDVVLDDSGRPAVFVSAGIGITPMAGMLSTLAAAGSHLPVRVLHADLDESLSPSASRFVTDVRALPDAAMYAWYERGATDTLSLVGVFAGLMDLNQVDLPATAIYYLCGPLPFMQAVRSALIERDVAPRDIQYEVFGPDLWQADLVTETSPQDQPPAREVAGRPTADGMTPPSVSVFIWRCRYR